MPSPLAFVRDFYDALERVNTHAGLQAEMGLFAAKMGFDSFAYVLTISAPSIRRQQYIISGFPAEWSERYLSHNYFEVDPVVQHTESSTLPISWSHDALHDSESEEFWEEAHSHGLRAGLSFAVREQSCAMGIMSLARDKALDLPEQELLALIGHSQMFAGLLHRAVARIALPAVLPQYRAMLTGRELECLRWAAEGKTAWEISRILGIGERTVVYHLNNVAKKLDATSRTQAIVRAVGLKLI